METNNGSFAWIQAMEFLISGDDEMDWIEMYLLGAIFLILNLLIWLLYLKCRKKFTPARMLPNLSKKKKKNMKFKRKSKILSGL